MTTTGWVDLDLRHLATLRVLAEELSFRATAARLGFAQSAISQHITTLEHRVGARLVRRGPGVRRVELTPAGELLLDHADAILARVAVAERDFAHRAATGPTVVKVGVFQSVGATMMPRAVTFVRSRSSDVAVQLVESASPLDLVLSGELDLAFTEQRPMSDGIRYVELLEDPYVLVTSASRPGPEMPIDGPALGGLPLMTYKTSCHLREVERRLGQAGIALRVIVRLDDGPTLLVLAAEGLGCSLLPQLALRRETTSGLLHVHAVDPGAVAPRTICLAWNADREPSESMRLVVAGVEAAAREIASDAGGATVHRMLLVARPTP
jgi:DNA-binding transcriptional LysR family regulator